MPTAGYSEVTFRYDYSRFQVRAWGGDDLYQDPDDVERGVAYDGLVTAAATRMVITTRGEWGLVHVEARGAAAGEVVEADPALQATSLVLTTPGRLLVIGDSYGAPQLSVSTPSTRTRVLVEVLPFPGDDVDVDRIDDSGERYRITASEATGPEEWVSQNPSTSQVQRLEYWTERPHPEPWIRRSWAPTGQHLGRE